MSQLSSACASRRTGHASPPRSSCIHGRQPLPLNFIRVARTFSSQYFVSLSSTLRFFDACVGGASLRLHHERAHSPWGTPSGVTTSEDMIWNPRVGNVRAPIGPVPFVCSTSPICRLVPSIGTYANGAPQIRAMVAVNDASAMPWVSTSRSMNR